MRLAFVHGINNQDNTPERIEKEWWEALATGWADLGLPALDKPKIEVAYYGKLLADATDGVVSGAIAQGEALENSEAGAAFVAEYMLEYSITETELAQELRQQGVNAPSSVPQGWIQGALVDTVGAIEKILQGRGQLVAALFLKQATHYIANPGLAAQINLNVRKQIFDDHDDDLLIVSHSLGTVVMYKMLATDNRAKRRHVPLFATLGSPLGIGMMQQILPARTTIPNPPIHAWVNAYRKDDFVALDRALDETTIGLSGIKNISTGLIEETDKHSVIAYLRSAPVCSRIHTALNAI